MKNSQILEQFTKKLDSEVNAQSNQHDYDEGEFEHVWPDGEVGKFVFSKSIKQRIIESTRDTLRYVLDVIVPRFPPSSRKGRGGDGGQRTESGQPFDLP